MLLRSLKLCQDLNAPPPLPASLTVHGLSGLPENYEELCSIAGIWKKGLSFVLWCNYKLRQDGVDIEDNVAFKKSMESLGLSYELDVPTNEVVGTVDTSVLLINLFNGDTVTAKGYKSGFMRAAQLGDMTPYDHAVSMSVVPESVQWMNNVLARDLWGSTEGVQATWDMLGPLTSAWIVTHSSAGSAAFNRLDSFSRIVGVRTTGPVQIQRVLYKYGIQPAFAISYLNGSFGSMELEGGMFASILLKVAMAWSLRGEQLKEHYNKICNAFLAALNSPTEDEMRRSMGTFGRTVISTGARANLGDRLRSALSTLSERDAWPALESKVKALNTGCVLFDGSLTQRKIDQIMVELRHAPIPPAATPAVSLSDVLEAALGDVIGDDEVIKRTFRSVTPEECKTIRSRAEFTHPDNSEETMRSGFAKSIIVTNITAAIVPEDIEYPHELTWREAAGKVLG